MRKRILTMSLVMVMVLSFTACDKEPSAQEIVDGVIESFDNIRTYQFDMVTTQDMTGEAEDEAFEQTVTMDISGRLDLENVQMRADLTMNVNMAAPEEDEMEEGVEMYIIDGMMYAKPEAPGEEPVWTKEVAPVEVWESMSGISGLENYKELLKTAQVKVIGSEKVKGVDCYELQLTPEMTQLWQIAMRPAGEVVRGGILSTVTEELLEEVFRSFSVKQWIAKDTYFLMRVEIDIAMDMTMEENPEIMDYFGQEGEMTMDITLSFLAYNYNQPVSIELPLEAGGLEEMIEDRGPFWSPDGSRIAFTSQ